MSLFSRCVGLSVLLVLLFLALPSDVRAEPPIGISSLLDRPWTNVQELLDSTTLPLLTKRAQERYLEELEKSPPDWTSLNDQPGEERGSRLFRFNRARDKAREGHALLEQHVAFLWSGILRQYEPKYKGFRVAVGPVITQTDWGVTRFKPVNLPDDMIAIPSTKHLNKLKEKIARGEQIEIDILFKGFLTSEESLMYAFAHDNSEEGMILPFIHIDGVQYILR